MSKPDRYDIDYWTNELPVGSRVSWGKAWGRGTVINSETKLYGNGKHGVCITVKFDGDRYNLSHCGTAMGPKQVNKLKDSAKIRFGSFCSGRGKITYAMTGDTISFAGKEWQIKGGVYDGRIHVAYIVPDISSKWHESNFDGGIWISRDIDASTIIKPYNPYKNRQGKLPDTAEFIREDLGLNNSQSIQQTLFSLFNEEFPNSQKRWDKLKEKHS